MQTPRSLKQQLARQIAENQRLRADLARHQQVAKHVRDAFRALYPPRDPK